MATDEALAQRLKGGDRAALAELVERHYDPLLGYLYRLTRGDRSLAQDLAQETFLRALRGIASYQHPRPFKPWLYAIATNLGRNHYTRADTRRTENAPDNAEYGLDEPPDSALLAQAEAQGVIAALDTLSDAQREVIVLYFYQSLPLQVIADTLSIPLGTVKSRLSIGVGRLRNYLKAENDEPARER